MWGVGFGVWGGNQERDGWVYSFWRLRSVRISVLSARRRSSYLPACSFCWRCVCASFSFASSSACSADSLWDVVDTSISLVATSFS